MFSLSLLIWKDYTIYSSNKLEKEKIDNFFQTTIDNITLDGNPNLYHIENITKKTDKKEEPYIAVIKIPKIFLEKGLYPKDSPYNQVDKNIEILKESIMPTEEHSHVILASHAGTSPVAYFNRLNELEKGDKIYLYYQNKVYLYEVKRKYEIEKTGYANIKRNIEQKYLTMITCKIGTNQQIVVMTECISEEEYRM